MLKASAAVGPWTFLRDSLPYMIMLVVALS